MFYHFIYPLSREYFFLNIFKYITFRSVSAFLIAAVISMIWGQFFIKFMKRKQFGQFIREDGPKSHLKKAGTPTMGGLFLLGSIFIGVAMCSNFFSPPLLLVILVMTSYFILGFLDDYLKALRRNSKGISGRIKLLWQFTTALIVGYILIKYQIISTELYVPFVKDSVCDLGWGYVFFAAIVIVGSSNAVNLTDGLDGLAIGPIITSALTLGILAYIAGHKEMSAYLFVPYIEGVGELTVVSATIIGAGVGFLWYNSYPAQIFMGDVGSLSLGGVLGTIAVITKNEFLFVVIGGVFVIEALSVILQVGSYKLRRKRIFKMAPIHHHFELKGWPEPKVIVRFWIVSIFLAIVAIATLKIR